MAIRSLLELILRSRKEGDAARQVAQDLKQVKQEASGAGQELEQMSAMSLKAKAGLLALAVGTAAFIGSAVKLAARVEMLGVVTVQLGETAGLTKEEVRGLEEAIQDQGITTQKSRVALARMIQANIDLAHATDLARLAQDAAVIAGINSSEAFEHLINVIVTGNVRMGRTIGLQLQFGQALQNTANQLGKNVDELTEQEIIQARTNEVMRQGAAIAGTYEAAMETAGKQMLSLDRQIEEIKLAFGEEFLPVLQSVVGWLYEFTKAINEAREASEKEHEERWNNIEALEAFIENIDEVPARYRSLAEASAKARLAELTHRETILEVAASYGDLNAKSEIMRQAMLNVVSPIQELTGATTELLNANRQLSLSLSEVTAASLAKEAMDKLNIAWETGTITQEEYEALFTEIASGMGIMESEAIQAQLKIFALNQEFSKGQMDVEGYINRVQALALELDLLPEEVVVRIRMEEEGIWDAHQSGYQHGGSFIVRGPPGPDKTLVAFKATAGEKVTVTTPSQVGPNGGGFINYGDINISGASGDPSAMVDEFLAELGKRQQQANASGMGYIGA